jgi:hypothetical protein
MGDVAGEQKLQSIGPAQVSLFGTEIPILPLALGFLGLILARTLAPPAVRRLTRVQQVALTALLAILLFLIVTGSFTGVPLDAGMAVVWGIGLGFSGLLSIEFMGERCMAALRTMIGGAGSSSHYSPSDRMGAELKRLAESIPDPGHRSVAQIENLVDAGGGSTNSGDSASTAPTAAQTRSAPSRNSGPRLQATRTEP